MFKFMYNIQEEIIDDIINVLDNITESTHYLYNKITSNLKLIIRSQFGGKQCSDKYLV